MRLELTRFDFTEARTIGHLAILDAPEALDSQPTFTCFTLEDPVRAPGVKIAGATAIPVGRYRVRLTRSARFQRVLPLLDDVPGFTGIRLHAGNTAADTAGCILVGLRREADAILDSRAALDALLPHLEAVAAPEEIWIDVVDGRAAPKSA